MEGVLRFTLCGWCLFWMERGPGISISWQGGEEGEENVLHLQRLQSPLLSYSHCPGICTVLYTTLTKAHLIFMGFSLESDSLLKI